MGNGQNLACQLCKHLLHTQRPKECAWLLLVWLQKREQRLSAGVKRQFWRMALILAQSPIFGRKKQNGPTIKQQRVTVVVQTQFPICPPLWPFPGNVKITIMGFCISIAKNRLPIWQTWIASCICLPSPKPEAET